MYLFSVNQVSRAKQQTHTKYVASSDTFASSDAVLRSQRAPKRERSCTLELPNMQQRPSLFTAQRNPVSSTRKTKPPAYPCPAASGPPSSESRAGTASPRPTRPLSCCASAGAAAHARSTRPYGDESAGPGGAVHCRRHRAAGEVDVVHRRTRCAACPACGRQASFSPPPASAVGLRRPLYCAAHRAPGHVGELRGGRRRDEVLRGAPSRARARASARRHAAVS